MTKNIKHNNFPSISSLYLRQPHFVIFLPLITLRNIAKSLVIFVYLCLVPCLTMTTTQLRNLHVHVKMPVGSKTDYEEILTSTTEYKIVRDSIDKALVLLEYGLGRNSLRQLAEAIIRGRWAAGNQHCLYPRSDVNFEQLDSRINQFLRQMRQGFPPVLLRAVAGEAATMRKTWTRANSTLDDYDTQEAGELHIHHGVCLQ